MKKQEVFTDIFPNNSIVSVHQLDNGVEGKVYYVVTEQGPMVVKYFSQRRIINYPDTFNKEVELFQLLSSYNVAVPQIYKYSRSQNCLCYYYIDGEQIIPNEKEFETIARYLKTMSLCNIAQMRFLPFMSEEYLMQELQIMADYEPFYNSCLKRELIRLRINELSMTLSHGDFHHGNMIWTKNRNHLTLIDWDEALIAPVEFDISRFFVSHSVFSNIQTATVFLSFCEDRFKISKDVLSFFIHFNAYYCLIRYANWTDGFFCRHNIHTKDETKSILEKLITI